MAKKSSAKPKVISKKTTKRFRPAREHVIMVVLAIIGIFALGYFTFAQYQISQEKKAFADAEVVLAQLSEDIEAKLGKPISSETTKSCGYSSAKFSKGTLGCGVGFVLKYPSLGLEDMKQKQFTILTEIKTAPKIELTSSNYAAFEEIQSLSSRKSTEASFVITNSSLTCLESISIEVNNPELRVGFNCFKKSNKEYFPVKE